MTGVAGTDGLLLHASCVAWQDRAVVISGQSGSGKSTLALNLMAFGCMLVADDQTQLTKRGGILIASSPVSIRGQIEARGIGILNADANDHAPVVLAVDLDHVEASRLPPQRSVTYLGVELPLIYGTESANFAASVLQILKAGLSTV